MRALTERAAALTTGPGTDPGSDMGPLITEVHRDRVAGYVDSAEREGAEVVVDGREVKVPGGEDGFFLGPMPGGPGDRRRCRSTGTRSSGRCCPCCGSTTSTRPSSWSMPIPTATARPSSPGTVAAARRFRRHVQVGMVGINVAIPVPMAYYSFGGWKQSLFGDAHIHGMEGVRFNTRLKSVTTRWPESARSRPRRSGIAMHFPLGRQGPTTLIIDGDETST